MQGLHLTPGTNRPRLLPSHPGYHKHAKSERGGEAANGPARHDDSSRMSIHRSPWSDPRQM